MVKVTLSPLQEHPASAILATPTPKPPTKVVAKSANFDDIDIMVHLTAQPLPIEILIKKLSISDKFEIEYLQVKLKVLEQNHQINVVVKSGKKYYHRKTTIPPISPSRIFADHPPLIADENKFRRPGRWQD